jgi:hypothetical protein
VCLELVLVARVLLLLLFVFWQVVRQQLIDAMEAGGTDVITFTFNGVEMSFTLEELTVCANALLFSFRTELLLLWVFPAVLPRLLRGVLCVVDAIPGDNATAGHWWTHCHNFGRCSEHGSEHKRRVNRPNYQ